MQKLTGSAARYTSGAYPSHSAHSKLASNFEHMDANALRFILRKRGWVTDTGSPTKKAAADGVIDALGGQPLWNLKELERILTENGDRLTRKPVNQDLPEPESAEPSWVNLGTVGSYFSVSASIVGKWLDQLELRDADKMGSKDAADQGLCTTVEMSTGQGKNQTRKITHWNLYAVQKLLMEAGHLLDFDYESTLKGRGRNSDVEVDTVESRAKAFAKEFTTIFKDKAKRRELPELVRRTPKPIQRKAEELIGRLGFITEGVYLKHLDRK